MSFDLRYAVFKVLFPGKMIREDGDEGTRTPDLLLARQALSHLSYTPKCEIFLTSKWA